MIAYLSCLKSVEHHYLASVSSAARFAASAFNLSCAMKHRGIELIQLQKLSVSSLAMDNDQYSLYKKF